MRVANEQAMVAMGERLAKVLVPGDRIYLSGELGSGKTTMVRGILRGFGHTGSVTSPTFTLLEPYETLSIPIFHFDLYRMNSPEELEYIGVRDYFTEQNLCLVEWPEKSAGLLPAASLHMRIEYAGVARQLSVLNANRNALSREINNNEE